MYLSGSRIYIAGGMTSPGLNCHSRLEVYDVELDMWLQDAESLPYPATGLTLTSM